MKKLLMICVLSFIGVVAYGQPVEQAVEISVDGFLIKGTLMLPSVEQTGRVPVALIIAGSGPTDRNGNSTMMRNNSLKMVAQGLANQGIASLRYDKRGIAASSSVLFDQSKVTIDTYAIDAGEWVDFLRNDHRFSTISIIGHSEGSLLALIAAHKGVSVDNIISLAGAGRSLDLVLKEQLASQPQKIRQTAYNIIDTLSMGRICNDVPVFLNSLFNLSIQPFLISWFSYDARKLAEDLPLPLLIVQGDTDIQITVADAMSLSSANHSAELVVIHNMNHVLKHCQSRSRDEQVRTCYSDPSLALHPQLMPVITKFILSHNAHN